MTYHKRKTRNGRASDIARLDVHDWLGGIMYRIKGKTSDKAIGVSIILTVKDVFDLSEADIRDIATKFHEEEIEIQERKLGWKTREPFK